MIPLLGTIFSGIQSIFSGIDSISTTDEEKLQWKAKLMEYQVQVLTATVALEKEFQKANAVIRQAEMKSDHVLVWSMRPILTYLTAGVWLGSASGILPGFDPNQAFYAFGLVAGLFSGTRGVEKIARTLKSKEII